VEAVRPACAAKPDVALTVFNPIARLAWQVKAWRVCRTQGSWTLPQRRLRPRSRGGSAPSNTALDRESDLDIGPFRRGVMSEAPKVTATAARSRSQTFAMTMVRGHRARTALTTLIDRGVYPTDYGLNNMAFRKPVSTGLLVSHAFTLPAELPAANSLSDSKASITSAEVWANGETRRGCHRCIPASHIRVLRNCTAANQMFLIAVPGLAASASAFARRVIKAAPEKRRLAGTRWPNVIATKAGTGFRHPGSQHGLWIERGSCEATGNVACSDVACK